MINIQLDEHIFLYQYLNVHNINSSDSISYMLTVCIQFFGVN